MKIMELTPVENKMNWTNLIAFVRALLSAIAVVTAGWFFFVDGDFEAAMILMVLAIWNKI